MNTLKPYGTKKVPAKSFTLPTERCEHFEPIEDNIEAEDMPMGYMDYPPCVWLVEFNDVAVRTAYWTYDNAVCEAAAYIVDELEPDNPGELFDTIVDKLIDDGPDARFEGSELVSITKMEVN